MLYMKSITLILVLCYTQAISISMHLLVCCLLSHTVTPSLCSVSETHASPDFRQCFCGQL